MALPKKNVAYAFDIPGLVDASDATAFKVNPTLATGDVKVAGATGSGAMSSYANISTLPDVSPAGGRNVRVQLSQAEMNFDRVLVQFVDAAGGEWLELGVELVTSAQTVDDLPTQSQITGGAYALATNGSGQITVGSLANNVVTAASIASDAITAAKIADGAIDTATFASGTTIPRCTLTDTLTTYTGNTPQTGDSFARLGAPVGASIAADIAEIEVETDAIQAKTDSLTFTVAGKVDANALYVEGQLLSGKVGDNLNTFFQNGGTTSTTVVDDVGTGGGGGSATLDNQETIIDLLQTRTSTE